MGDVAESRIQREYNINDGEIKVGGIRSSRMRADYILIYKNRKLAVIEAKSNELEVGEGVAQAKLYATKLELDYTYAANGKEIYEICLTTGKEAVVTKRLRGVEGIAIDWIAKNLYFTDNVLGTISVVRLRSTNFSDRRELITQLGNPRAIVTDPGLG